MTMLARMAWRLRVRRLPARPENRIWFFPIEGPPGVAWPHEECDTITVNQAVAAGEWASRTPGVMIELYVQDDSDVEFGMPMIGWVVDEHGIGYGLGHDRTAALEAEVNARRRENGAAPFEAAWFRSLLRRSVHA